MGAATKHPVPDRVKQSFVIFDIRALWRSARASECPDVKNYQWRLNPVWRKMHPYVTSGCQRVNHRQKLPLLLANRKPAASTDQLAATALSSLLILTPSVRLLTSR